MNSVDIPTTLITPLRIIGKGGSAYIIEAVVNYDYHDLYRGQRVIFKHCIAFLTKAACDLFIKEATILRNLRTNLADTGICNNFPLYYGYITDCLFGSVEELDAIANEIPESVCKITGSPGFYEVPDDLFYYANKPELGMQLYTELRSRYSSDCLLAIRDKLKVANFDVIASIFPLASESGESSEIYNFLVEELDIQCAPNIVMSKIEGFDLASETTFMLTDGLIFEMIYTNACLIRFNGEVFRDINLGNIMIETYPYPRIYRIGSTHYMFLEGHRLVIIDAQVTAPAQTTRDLLGSIPSRVPSEKASIITGVASAATVDDVMRQVMPVAFAKFIVTEEYVKEILIAYPNIRIWSY